MLKIQEYISLFDDIKEANMHLIERLNLDIYQDVLRVGEDGLELEDVYVYNSHPTKSPIDDPMVQEACGLILNEDGDIISMSFKKIAKLNKTNAHLINWHNAKAELIEDGTLVVIYYYKGLWNVQTKTRANADNAMLSSNISLRTAVMTVLAEYFTGFSPFSPFDVCNNKDLCYAFEFISPYNRRVTQYFDSNLILLGVWDKLTLEEKSEEWINNFHIHCCGKHRFVRPRTYGVGSLETAMELPGFIDTAQIGFVVKDIAMNRFKVLNPSYAAISKFAKSEGRASAKTYAKLTLDGGLMEARHMYPLYSPIFNLFFQTSLEISKTVMRLWENYKDIEDKKEFAATVKHHFPVLRTYLFMLRRKQIKNIEDGMRKMRPEVFADAVRKSFPEDFNRFFETGGAKIEN